MTLLTARRREPAAPTGDTPPGDDVTGTASPLRAEQIRLGYGDRVIVHDVDLQIPAGRITVLIGENGCGKSTLLRGLSRLLTPVSGRALLDGADIARLSTREVARRIGLLPQSPLVPDGITVAELVRRGRHPHGRSVLAALRGQRSASTGDDEIVAQALLETGVADLATRRVDELSGGQRQRAWIAMVLAQRTPILLLDEPTSSLDVAHQLDVLDLVARLRDERGITVVMVLHDLTMAARYADHVVAVRRGRIAASGPVSEVFTEDRIGEVFELVCRIVTDPDTGRPVVLPRPRTTASGPDGHGHGGDGDGDGEGDVGGRAVADGDAAGESGSRA